MRSATLCLLIFSTACGMGSIAPAYDNSVSPGDPDVATSPVSRSPRQAPTTEAAAESGPTGERAIARSSDLSTVHNGHWFASRWSARISATREWAMVGDLPEQAGVDPVTIDDAWTWGVWADALSGNPKLVSSQQLDCYARQHGAFFLLHGGWPSAALDSYIAGRCGVVGSRVSVFHRVVPQGASPEGALAARSELVGAMQETADGQHVAYRRTDGATSTVHTIAYAEPRVRVHPFSLAGAPGQFVTVTGRMPDDAAAIRAASTLGSVSLRPCRFRVRRDASFSLRCQVDWTRPTTMIEATYVVGDRRDQRSVKTLRLTLSQPTAPRHLAVESISDPTTTGPLDRGSLLTAINSARFRAGQPRVVEDPDRSLAAERLWGDDGRPAYDEIADLRYQDLTFDRLERPDTVTLWRAAGYASAAQVVDEALVYPLARMGLVQRARLVALSVRRTEGDAATNVLVVLY